MHEQSANAYNCCCAHSNAVGLLALQHPVHQGQDVLPAADFQAVQVKVQAIKHACSMTTQLASYPGEGTTQRVCLQHVKVQTIKYACSISTQLASCPGEGTTSKCACSTKITCAQSQQGRRGNRAYGGGDYSQRDALQLRCSACWQ